jgi:hypothetical protein
MSQRNRVHLHTLFLYGYYPLILACDLFLWGFQTQMLLVLYSFPPCGLRRQFTTHQKAVAQFRQTFCKVLSNNEVMLVMTPSSNHSFEGKYILHLCGNQKVETVPSSKIPRNDRRYLIEIRGAILFLQRWDLFSHGSYIFHKSHRS